MNRPGIIACVLLLLLLTAATGCAVLERFGPKKAKSPAPASLSLPYEAPDSSFAFPSIPDEPIAEDAGGEGDLIIMNAVKDEDGEMVATDVITAAVVQARFRNVAERHGKVDLRFRIMVPPEMHSSKWQLRLYPQMTVLGDTVSLDPVIVTGSKYRKAQLRGYQQYERFLSSIIRNDSLLVDMGQLEIFLKRNLPDLYAFKKDSTLVSDSLFFSYYGVDEQEAVEHYRRKLLIWYNDLKISRSDKVFHRYVKAPIITEGLRLDTVLTTEGGQFIYDYVQTLYTRPDLRKAEIGMSGEIFDADKKVSEVPQSLPLTFYISSMSSLVDGSERFLSRVIERRVEANTACYIAFEAGKAEVNPTLDSNEEEMGRIRGNLSSLARNLEFDLDSVIVTASASPEGAYKANQALSSRRSQAVVKYFSDYVGQVRDSIAAENRYSIGELQEGDIQIVAQPIHFVSRSNAENWTMLDAIVRSDRMLSKSDKELYFSLSGIQDPDERESRLRLLPCYKYFRESLYPRLRTVKFDFFLHRKGMIQDTVHTTVIDSAYMRGVQAIRDRDYQTAVTILRPYRDYNAALAFCSMDYNASALDILEGLQRSSRVNYLLAIVHSRMGRPRQAAEFYLKSCEQDPSLVHRGNLDPEIAALIEKYHLSSK